MSIIYTYGKKKNAVNTSKLNEHEFGVTNLYVLIFHDLYNSLVRYHYIYFLNLFLYLFSVQKSEKHVVGVQIAGGTDPRHPGCHFSVSEDPSRGARADCACT